MKKRILALLPAVLLLLSCTAFAATTAEPPLPALDGADVLRTVSYELNIDEENGTLDAVLLLQNVSEEEYSGSFTLPDGGLAAEPESILALLNGEAVRLTDGKAALTVPAGGYATLQWRFDTVNLRNVKIISADLNALPRPENCRIGRVSVKIALSDEDVPLVTDVKPVCYLFDGKTVSVSLYDFTPSCLLDRIVLEKETWQNLKSSREFEPNEAQTFVLNHYKEWFANGIDISGCDWVSGWFDAAMGPDTESMSREEQSKAGYSTLAEHTPMFERAVNFFYYSAAVRELSEDDYWLYSMAFCTEYYNLPPLMRDLYSGRFGGAGQEDAFVLSYKRNPSLADVPLFVETVTNPGADEWDYETAAEAADEETALKTDIPVNHKTFDCALSSHIAVIPADTAATAEEILDFSEAIGAKMLIRVELFDGIHETYPTWTDGYYTEYDSSGDPVPGSYEEYTCYANLVTGYCGEENRVIAEKACGYYGTEWAGENEYVVLETDDEILKNARIPAYLLYRGYVTEEDGTALVNLSEAHYRGWDTGFSRFGEISGTDRGRQLLADAEARRSGAEEAARAEADANLLAGEPLPVEREVPPEPAEPETAGPETEPAGTAERESGFVTEPAEEKTGKNTAGRILVPAFLGTGGLLLVSGILILTVTQKKHKKKGTEK